MRHSLPALPSIKSNPVYQRRDLIERAWALPVAKLYAPLQSQSWTAICGPTSVANVLRSMGVRAGNNPFKRPGMRAMSLDQVSLESADIVPSGWKVKSVRPKSVEETRAQLQLSNDSNYRFISNFARTSLFGGGSGHHSPIGGYLEDEDIAFVLDVNAGYGPWLVTTERLFDAMNTGDWGEGLTRGLARFERVA
ncbi:phytochelatin synthase family protein [Vitiosangium sp. GDMCC 1.1324]|uniref:phytochelatin synthase family protein n=1 Tax=Vitiosangium sp. (strain GDMCC 1.1324) TaxID=2138576 RepID=UPI000D33E8A7|nr:phytochelatin synthase family protein [Vitiosangium sp. GDMCC 1.1324]PTL80181.1 phytochelatin synthase [Vitiosangium sp. GDMCC 1.1324]